ncbi:MAG: class 1 fructose-bisphosphatase [archaeon]
MELKEHLKKKGVQPELCKLILLVADISKDISAAFHTHQHITDTKNIHGEQQMALDKHADMLLINAMEKSKLVRNVASEEQDEILEIKKAEGSYGVVMDPLDGSSLINVNLSVGTIVGFFDEGNVMEPGKKMDAAMYVLYGPITSLVYCAGGGVHEFVLDQDGVYRCRAEDLMIPDGKIYSPGGTRKDYTPSHRTFIENLEDRGFKPRFSGGFVPDFNIVLHQGGVFTYPALEGKPNGKLRLLFEGNPMGFIAKHAGGYASDGHGPMLDKKPVSIADRTPLYIGSKSIVKEIEEIQSKEGEQDS